MRGADADADAEPRPRESSAVEGSAGDDELTIAVNVRLFAMLREAAGGGSLVLELKPGATVADALDQLRGRGRLGELLRALPVRAAVNRDYADQGTTLVQGDELALIPPVSGGASESIASRVSDKPLSIDALAASVGRAGAGAIVVFAGTTRDVERLDYEAYAEMAAER
nr:MoaD/ThiS family protein [Solirubrobacterales bacterium]